MAFNLRNPIFVRLFPQFELKDVPQPEIEASFVEEKPIETFHPLYVRVAVGLLLVVVVFGWLIDAGYF